MNTTIGSFDPVAAVPEYRDVNLRCMRRWADLMQRFGGSPNSIVDVATGVGTMIQIALECGMTPSRIIAVDMSQEALVLAANNLREVGVNVEFIRSQAQTMWVGAGIADVVIWGNGIHYLTLPEQVIALQRMSLALKYGGLLFFNTTFFAEGVPAETHQFYTHWIKEAVRLLARKKIQREKIAKPQAAAYPPALHFVNLLQAVNMKAVDVAQLDMPATVNFAHAIAGYHQFAGGALHGYPVGEAAAALQATAADAIEKHGVAGLNGKYILRKWLAVAARKP